ncbi:MAG: toll/interleukin-1 receptor domain-containing protein [Planctomycetaceae bacterium]
MSSAPIGFLSYARSDDEHDKGRITEIRQRLSGEVRIQTGESFHIFQDRDDIAWGQQWQLRIFESLDEVTFLIPILTPGFFKSEPCRSELQRFLDRERELHRADLILPVYYVDCAMLNDSQIRQEDSLAQAIYTRQYADWRELRFEAITSPQVSKVIAKMAKQVAEALSRPSTKSAVAVTASLGPQSEVSSNDKSAALAHADDRLNKPIDFGSTLPEIAKRFKIRMDEFNAIDGGGPNKFLDLGTHVFTCVAICLDRYATHTATTRENRNIAQTLSLKLKRLANYDPKYLSRNPFPKFWADGTEICEELVAHSSHLERIAGR